jgi:hypothetical protein
MPASGQASTPAARERARSRLRFLTRGAIVTATGATVAIGIVVAHDRPGAGATRTTTTNTPSSTSGGSSSSAGTSDSGDSGTTGTTGNTGTSTSAPTATSSRPTVTSGGTSQ